jgi:hypothetical protein
MISRRRERSLSQHTKSLLFFFASRKRIATFFFKAVGDANPTSSSIGVATAMQSNNSQIHAAAVQAQAQVQPQQQPPQPPQQVPVLIQQAAVPNPPVATQPTALQKYLFCVFWDDECQGRETECGCWTMIIVYTVLALGLICGFVVMPCFLAKAYDDVYQDTCIIEHCNGYAANIQATGVRRSFEFFFKDKSCRSLLNKPRPCFLKLNIDSNTYQVYFTRPGWWRQSQLAPLGGASSSDC